MITSETLLSAVLKGCSRAPANTARTRSRSATMASLNCLGGIFSSSLAAGFSRCLVGDGLHRERRQASCNLGPSDAGGMIAMIKGPNERPTWGYA